MESEKPQVELSLNQRLKKWARKLKGEIIALYFTLRHPQTPLFTKIIAAIVVGYALSPIDLIPDFIPILGYLDDVILLPLGIALVVRIIPKDILDACREEARINPPVMKPKIWLAAYVIMMIWVAILYLTYVWIK